jgi:hypothetical protein
MEIIYGGLSVDAEDNKLEGNIHPDRLGETKEESWVDAP